ncbi:Cupin domain protein [Roseovarius marisflavi]|uniref:Cupin domain protein n=1 Tax=Roseovarius marisflavi TaxID=1054996 RepID=A0A1M7DT24_9RHOB|nr:cupin domain-containing protein [Roseovarius marisflavi]SHL82533.1 Cupin domain protein [Roseovarius marisflavi]
MLFDKVSATISANVEGRAVSWRRPRHRLPSVLIYSLAAIASTVIAVADGHANDAKPGSPGVQRDLLIQIPLPDFPGRIMTALTIELAPGEVVGPHRHGGFVYVYLLQGKVRSQLEGEDPVEYSAGQSWTEQAEVLHRRTENPSTTVPAKFLAVIYSDADAVITRPEMDDH